MILLGLFTYEPNVILGPLNNRVPTKSTCSQKTSILPSNILYFPSTTTNTKRNPSCLNNVQERGFQIFRIIFCELASWLSAWWRIESQKGPVDGLLKALPFFLLYCQKITHFFYFLFFVVYRLSIVYTHIKPKNMSI